MRHCNRVDCRGAPWREACAREEEWHNARSKPRALSASKALPDLTARLGLLREPAERGEPRPPRTRSYAVHLARTVGSSLSKWRPLPGNEIVWRAWLRVQRIGIGLVGEAIRFARPKGNFGRRPLSPSEVAYEETGPGSSERPGPPTAPADGTLAAGPPRFGNAASRQAERRNCLRPGLLRHGWQQGLREPTRPHQVLARAPCVNCLECRVRFSYWAASGSSLPIRPESLPF